LRRAAAGLASLSPTPRWPAISPPPPRSTPRYDAVGPGHDADRVAELVVDRADPLAANWFESSSRWWLLEAGLPRPRLQVPFSDKRGRVAKVDMLIGRVVGEADGAGKYDDPGALFAEKLREDWLRDVPGRGRAVGAAEMRSRSGRAEVVARFGAQRRVS
jgi:hypothetical protein